MPLYIFFPLFHPLPFFGGMLVSVAGNVTILLGYSSREPPCPKPTFEDRSKFFLIYPCHTFNRRSIHIMLLYYYIFYGRGLCMVCPIGRQYFSDTKQMFCGDKKAKRRIHTIVGWDICIRPNLPFLSPTTPIRII